MKFKKYRNLAWIKKMDFEKDEYRQEKAEKEGKGKNCDDRDVWLAEKEREHNLKEAYKINLRRQRKHGKRRDVDDKE